MTNGARTTLMLALLATGVAASAWLAGPVAAQAETYLPANIGDLSKAKVIEVKDSTGTVVLCGQLIRQPTVGDEIEREAELISCGAASKATGEAEVEVQKEVDRLDQEVELSVLNLTPNATFTIYIDTKQVGTFKTNNSGAAEVELKTAPPTPAKK